MGGLFTCKLGLSYYVGIFKNVGNEFGLWNALQKQSWATYG